MSDQAHLSENRAVFQSSSQILGAMHTLNQDFTSAFREEEHV
jgi:hypothetical protein